MPYEMTAVAFAPEPNTEESGYFGGQISAFSALTPRCAPWAGTFARRMQRLMSLQPNWDSYGAPSLSRVAGEAAVRFMFMMWERLPGAPQPEVFPEASGGVRFEWERSQMLTSLCFEPGLVTLYIADGEEEFESSFANDFEPILETLKRRLVK